MKMISYLIAVCLFSVFVSCGNNNNQHEGASGSDNTVESTSGATPESAGEAGKSTDTVIKAPDSDPGEGSTISGTGVNNGSGKTGGG